MIFKVILTISTQETAFNVVLVYWSRLAKGCYKYQTCSCPSCCTERNYSDIGWRKKYDSLYKIIWILFTLIWDRLVSGPITPVMNQIYVCVCVVAPKCTFLGVLVRHNNVSIALYKTHWIWLVAGSEWVTLGMNEGWRQKVRENECRNVWMQVIKQLKRMNGMSVLVNDIKIVGVQKMTFSDWN